MGWWVGLRGECVGEVREVVGVGREGSWTTESGTSYNPLTLSADMVNERRWWVLCVSASFFFLCRFQFKENLALCYHPNPATANYRDMRGGGGQTDRLTQ